MLNQKNFTLEEGYFVCAGHHTGQRPIVCDSSTLPVCESSEYQVGSLAPMWRGVGLDVGMEGVLMAERLKKAIGGG